MPAQPSSKPAQATATAPATTPAAVPGHGAALPATTLAQVAHTTPVRTRVNRQTGTRINLWAPLPNGQQGGGTSTWVVQCQPHNVAVTTHTTRKAAKATVYLPAMWCAGCAAIVQAKQAAAAASAAQAAQAPAAQAPAAPGGATA